jgi:hypothetical protein
LTVIKQFWNRDYERLGLPSAPRALLLIVKLFVFCAYVMDASYVDSAIEFISIWALANGFFNVFLPETSNKAWGSK